MSDTKNDFDTFQDFRDQAAEYFGFSAGKVIAGFLITHPQCLDPDQQERYDELRIYVEDSPELARHENGTAKEPLRTVEGKRVEPYETRVAKAWLGDRYEEFLAAGGRPSDVNRAVVQMNREFIERRNVDSKSGNSAGSAS